MEGKITYLITGANRGLGLGMARALLLRHNTTVIATIRSPSVSKNKLKSLSLGVGSQLVISHYSPDEGSPYTATELMTDILAQGIQSINTIIANLGIGTAFNSCATTTSSELLAHFRINTLGPVLLFQAVSPHLSPAAKFIVISSALGSIAGIEAGANYLAYGVSKAAVNLFVRKLHFEEEGVVSVAVHPGWVRTENGQNFADAVGVEVPPMSVEESVSGVLKQIDSATKTTTSGCFVGWDGSVLPW